MTNIDVERLKNKAIDEAVLGNYENAILLNQEILKLEPQDVDSIMQLAHAHWQLGDLSDAKKFYRQAIEIEPNNSLAKKRLLLLSSLNSKTTRLTPRRSQVRIVPITDLIEEPGKTKIVWLGNICKPEHLGPLRIGEETFLRSRKRRLEVRDIDTNFIGCLPDDISKRMLEFMSQGAAFEAFIFSIDRNEVKVYLREVAKPPKLRNVSSFVNEDLNALVEEEETEPKPLEEEDAEIDTEKLMLAPEEALSTEPAKHGRQSEDEEDEDEEEEDEDKETYQEYEE
jgi:tetratricopeptide (TPR) repeat protein